MSISPNELDAIRQKVRTAFLESDAPGYLDVLRAAVEHSYQDADYLSLLSALHSLKGGAGVAQFNTLHNLAHILEDLIQSLQTQSCIDQELAWTLFVRAIEEIDNAFKLKQELTITPELLQALEDLNQADSKSEKESDQFRFGLNNTITTASQVGQCIWSTTQKVVSKLNRAVDFKVFHPSSKISRYSLINPIHGWKTLNRFSLGACNPVAGKTLSLSNSATVATVADSAAATAPSPTAYDHPPAGSTPPRLAKFLRLPLEQLDQMASATEELIAWNERFSLQQQQLAQTHLRLQLLTPPLQLLQSSLQTVYDSLRYTSPLNPVALETIASLHGSLQGLEEFISFFQSARADLDLATRNLTENQKETRRDLEKLYTTLIRSRLVPFQKLAQLFLPHVGRLNQRYGKEVKLIVRGGEVLVDQSILEELRPSFNHLINNAFDHGIEPTAERMALNKPHRAEIILQATAQENELIFSVSDDGRGIDAPEIYRHALQRGIVSDQIPMSQLSQEEILSFLFRPGFSTTPNSNDLSGRGMGLDIVHDQVSSLGGTLRIETIVGQGTTFMIKLPPSLSFLPLLLCRLQKRIVAIPATSVLEIISYSELEWISVNPTLAHWRQSTIPVVHLSNLLQYSDTIADISQLPSEAGAVVLNGHSTPFIAIVDTVIGQQKLIVKPLEQIIKSPPYLAGCTILSTGELVPVLLPQKFGSLQHLLDTSSTRSSTNSSNQHQKNKTILLAEDSQATRILIEGLLKEEGFDVICCQDGQSALEEFGRHSKEIDLVISDIEMPKFDGFAFLRQIRHVHNSTLPVIILSDRTTDNYRHQAMDLGANAFVNKQSLSQVLVLTVKKLLLVSPLIYK